MYTYTLVHCTPSRTGKGLGTFVIQKVKAGSVREAMASFTGRKVTPEEIAFRK